MRRKLLPNKILYGVMCWFPWVRGPNSQKGICVGARVSKLYIPFLKLKQIKQVKPIKPDTLFIKSIMLLQLCKHCPEFYKVQNSQIGGNSYKYVYLYILIKSVNNAYLSGIEIVTNYTGSTKRRGEELLASNFKVLIALLNFPGLISA